MKTRLSGLVLILALALPVAASAQLTFNLNVSIGASPPAGPAPWLTATFSNFSANSVDLTMQGSGLTGNEFVPSWGFNFNPALNLAGLSWSHVSGAPIPTGFATNFVIPGPDSNSYGFVFEFPIAPPQNRFTAGDSVVVRLTHTGPITIADFNFVNASGHLSGARIQGIGMDDNASGFVTAIPEPSTYAAMLGGVALLFAVVRKRLLAARVAAAAA